MLPIIIGSSCSYQIMKEEDMSEFNFNPSLALKCIYGKNSKSAVSSLDFASILISNIAKSYQLFNFSLEFIENSTL